MTAEAHFAAQSSIPPLARDDHYLVGGGGGSRAILAVSGFIYAMHKARIENWKYIGGLSGGAIPTLMYASGLSAAQCVQMAIEVPFESLLTLRTSKWRVLFALLMKERYETTHPLSYVFGTDKVSTFIDERVPVWPEKYYCVAVVGTTQLFFTARGVFQCYHDGKIVQISDKPIKVSEALRASMAVPGFIEPRFWNGMQMVDGGVSWDGLCPIQAVMRNLGAKPTEIVACHVGSEKHEGFKGWLFNKWKELLRFGSPWTESEKDPTRFAAQGAMLVLPSLDKFGSMKFTLTEGEKWDAVRASFRATLSQLLKKGLIDHGKFLELVRLVNNRSHFIDDCKSQ